MTEIAEAGRSASARIRFRGRLRSRLDKQPRPVSQRERRFRYAGIAGRLSRESDYLSPVALRSDFSTSSRPAFDRKPFAESAACWRFDATLSGLVFRLMDFSRAAAPETNGVANDVPLADA